MEDESVSGRRGMFLAAFPLPASPAVPACLPFSCFFYFLFEQASGSFLFRFEFIIIFLFRPVPPSLPLTSLGSRKAARNMRRAASRGWFVKSKVLTKAWGREGGREVGRN